MPGYIIVKMESIIWSHLTKCGIPSPHPHPLLRIDLLKLVLYEVFWLVTGQTKNVFLLWNLGADPEVVRSPFLSQFYISFKNEIIVVLVRPNYFFFMGYLRNEIKSPNLTFIHTDPRKSWIRPWNLPSKLMQ